MIKLIRGNPLFIFSCDYDIDRLFMRNMQNVFYDCLLIIKCQRYSSVTKLPIGLIDLFSSFFIILSLKMRKLNMSSEKIRKNFRK
jgi:hypothetical protein